jgi:ankyrin repeat protein
VLHWAAINAHVGLVKVLIEAGANIFAKQRFGDTALHSAAYGGHAEVVKALIEAGAMTSVRNKYGWTPLDLSLAHRNCREVLQEAGAKPGLPIVRLPIPRLDESY